MFWRKKKSKDAELETSVYTLVTKLGVEHRKNERIVYPDKLIICNLPAFSFDGHKLLVKNISVGGCCILDPQEFLGPAVGLDVDLDLNWPDKTEKVRSRIVSRVDNRRHIQFMNLSPQRQVWLRKSMAAGARGLSLKQHIPSSDAGPNMDVVELWSSPNGDNVTLENHVHRSGKIYFREHQYVLCQGAWPVNDNGTRCSPEEFEKLLLFLANIPAPSDRLKALQVTLAILFQEGQS